MQIKKLLNPLSIALLYAIFGSVWILYSDRWVANLSDDMEMLSQMQTYKGWFYIILTAIPLFLLIKAHQRFVLESAQLLKSTEKKYENLFLSNPYPICVVDPETLGFINTNKKFIQTFGYTIRDLKNQTIHHVFAKKDHPLLEKIIRSTLTTGDQNEPIIVKGEPKNDSVISIELMIYEIRFQGQITLLFQMRDVTAELLNRQQIRDLTVHLERTVEERTRQLSSVNEELESFTYSVSHDLRAPLRAIDGFSNAIAMDNKNQLTEESQEYFQRVRRASQRMSQLIDDMLRLSRITRASLTIKEVNLSKIASEVMTTLDVSKSSLVTIEKDIQVDADEGLMHILMSNLLSNAVKYSSKTDNAVIQFGKETQGEQIVYYVKDNGVGFNNSDSNKIFKPFQRLHTESEFVGMGIGLATAKRIVARHGGEIWAEAHSGEGASFYFTLNS
ncbi:MAG: PAS domain S-box protein [Balneolales bacterium]|nr:PAS domain S-box protein [Balneolales bacterium]